MELRMEFDPALMVEKTKQEDFYLVSFACGSVLDKRFKTNGRID